MDFQILKFHDINYVKILIIIRTDNLSLIEKGKINTNVTNCE